MRIPGRMCSLPRIWHRRGIACGQPLHLHLCVRENPFVQTRPRMPVGMKVGPNRKRSFFAFSFQSNLLYVPALKWDPMKRLAKPPPRR